jgi:hypothetical protein
MSCFCICSFRLSPLNISKDFSRTTPSFSNPLSHFLGKNVVVEADYNNVVIIGRMIYYQIGSQEKPHRPFILVLENSQGKHVLRGDWISISEVK